MAARYETDPTDKAAFIASLATLLAREQTCQQGDGFYPSYNYYNFFSPTVTFTTGSTAGTGTGIPAGLCASVATGTATATNGSATIAGSGLPAVGAAVSISISGTRGGQPFSWQGRWSGSGSSITLSGLWAGDSGTITWISHSDGYHTMFSNAVDDATFNTANPCFWNSSSSITLGKPWGGANGSFTNYRGNLVGAGVQPFMAGIKALEYYFAIQATSGATQTGFQTLANQLTNWIKDTGYDPRTKGLFYGRGFGACEVPVNPPGFNQATFTSSPAFDYSISECQWGFGPGAVSAARALNSEAQNALRLIYETAPTSPNRTFGDNFYGAQWGDASLTTGLPTNDGFSNDYATSGALGAGKWYGFQFGVGMAHQWPAARLGGVAPVDTRTFTLGYVAPIGTTSTAVVYTAPSGASSTIACSAGACSLPTDWRQGNYLFRMEYTVPGGVMRGDLLPLKLQ
jgi:hypothetical protein